MTLAWTPGPKTPRDVWFAFGDSMCSGRGTMAEAPTGYEPAAYLYMVKTADAGHAVLDEPCGDGANDTAGVGPWGMFGWLASLQTGRETCIVNTGIGGSRTDQWVPGQTNYGNALGRLQRAMSRRDTTLRGILVYIGPNDAAFSATPAWLSNVQSTLAGIRTWAGRTAAQCPAIISRLPAFVPTDTTYSGWSYVQSEIAALADANHLLITPPSPADREAYNLHHKTGQNYTIAQSALALAMAHASWG